ncbi:MAG: hypothetical protein AAF682_06305 [Planctomycetota bacterium]
MQPNDFRLVLASLALFATSLSADILTVGPPGSGSDFADIQSAIDAASPGDVVLVAAGTYDGFRLELPLTIQGAGPDATRISEAFIVPTPTLVGVTGIDAGDVAVVAGMELDYQAASLQQGGLVEVAGCEGTVAFHDVDVLSIQSQSGVVTSEAARVLLSDVYAFGGGASGSPGPAYALATQDTGLWAIDSFFEAPQLFTPFSPVQKEAARFVSSTAQLSGTTVLAPSVGAPWAIEGGDGAWTQSATVDLARSEVHGADAMVGLPGGYGLRLLQRSTVTAYADATVAGGFDGAGTTQQDPVLVEPGSSFAEDRGFLPTLSVAQARVTGGDSLDVQLYGAPSATGELFASLGLGAGFQLPGAQGEVFLDPSALIPLGVVTLDAAGEASVSVQVPQLPVDAHWTAAFQWAETGGGAVVISNPGLVSVF